MLSDSYVKVIDVLGLSLHVSHGVLYIQALVDVRSTGAGIRCLYCSVPVYMLCFMYLGITLHFKYKTSSYQF